MFFRRSDDYEPILLHHKSSDGEQLYFSDLVNGELKGLCLEKEEMEKNKAISFGTGFFISKDGKIMTIVMWLVHILRNRNQSNF
jgi:hypothetical protein